MEDLINGKKAILEIKNKNGIEEKEFTIEEFREFIGSQDNIAIMSDCITLLEGNQLYDGNYYYRLIKGKKLVINMFEEYSKYFIDGANWIIETEGDY